MVTPYFLPIRGGITSFVRGLSSALQLEGVRTSIVARDADPSPEVLVVRRNPVDFAREASRLLRELRPDVIHAHGHWYALRAAVRGSGDMPIVFSFHTAWPHVGPIRAFALQRMLFQCAAVTFPSRSLRSNLEVRVPDSSVRVVPPGTYEPQVERGAARSFVASIASRDWRHTLGYVGKFEWPSKVEGFRMLLRALTFPELRGVGLVAAGGGAYLSRVEREVEDLGLDGRVRLLGDVSEPALVYLGCDVYCHPSLQEGMSMSVLEAMRAGSTIVGFRLPFMEEVITDEVHGLLVPPDPALLAAALARVLDNRTLAGQYGAAARERARAEFDWPSIANRFLTLYRGAG